MLTNELTKRADCGCELTPRGTLGVRFVTACSDMTAFDVPLSQMTVTDVQGMTDHINAAKQSAGFTPTLAQAQQ